MNFNGNQYIQQFLAAAQVAQVFNDAAVDYGVQIRQAEVADGELYWRVIGVHHLLPKENGRDHNIFVEALDEQGNRIRQARVHAASTFENNANPPKVTALDKGDADPMGCDFPMGKEATYSVWMKGSSPQSNDPSDRVEKLHTRHADEPFGVPGAGNTMGHHSFYVVFQRTHKGPTVLDEKAVQATARKLLDELVAGDSPLAVFARDHDLGAPVTAEFSAGGYRARGFVKGIVYAPLAHMQEIKQMAWQ